MPPRIEYPTGLKTCNRCGIEMPLARFYQVKARNGAPTADCRSCRAKRNAKPRKLKSEPTACEQCGSIFLPGKRPDLARYCSRRCGQTAWNRARGIKPMRVVVVDGKKQCTSCREWKTVDAFGRRKDRADVPLSSCKPCAAARARAYHSSERGRDTRYARNYGVTIEWYEATLAAQNGLCAICGSPPDSGNREHPRLAIDHDHKTGKPRGLLCFLCNSGLGRFEDDPKLLIRAYDYLLLDR